MEGGLFRHFDDDATAFLVAVVQVELASEVEDVAHRKWESETESLAEIVDLGEGCEY